MKTTHKLNVARQVEDLPIPVPGSQFELPNWGRKTGYRATAWAYLTREDGGDVVILNGEKWHATKASVLS